MRTEQLDAAIKFRVPAPLKKALEEIASQRHLVLADIAREAIREYLSGKRSKAKRAS